MSFVDDWNKQAQTSVAQSGVSHSWDEYFKQQEQQRTLKELQDKNNAKPKGNFLTSLLPTGGGIGGALGGAAGGAALGSVVPGVGTAIGGLLGAILGGAGGSAVGKVGQNAVEGESDLGKGVAGEALLGGLTSTPLTAGLKLAKAGVKVATGLGKSSAEQLAKEAGQLAIPKFAGGLQAKAGQEVANAATNTVASTPNRLSNAINGILRTTDAKSSGLGVGQKLNGKTITNSRSNELLDFARGNGIQAGTPNAQAAAADNLLKGTSNNLTASLDSINRPLLNTDTTAITKQINNALLSSKGIGSKANIDTNKFLADINSAKDIKGLEVLRKEADQLAFTTNGAGKTAAAKQAQIIRDALDKFVTKQSADYKAVKGTYQNAKDLVELQSKNARSSKGGINVLGNQVGTQVFPGIMSKGSNVLSNVLPTGGKVVDTGIKTTGQGILGATMRQSLLGQRPSMGQTPTPTPTLDSNGLTQEDLTSLQSNPLFAGTNIGQQDQSSQIQDPATSNPFGISLTDVAGQLQKAIQNGDSKGYATLSDLYDKINTYQKDQQTTSKPLSATAAAAVGNASSGINSLAQVRDILNSQGGQVSKATLIPGRDQFGNLGANVLGTANFDNAIGNITDVISRMRSGAALSAKEEAFYRSQLPQAFDSPETIQQKLSLFDELFNRVANSSGTSGSVADAVANGQ